MFLKEGTYSQSIARYIYRYAVETDKEHTGLRTHSQFPEKRWSQLAGAFVKEPCVLGNGPVVTGF
jgi:hypothetical protein